MNDIFDYRRFLLICMKKWLIVLTGVIAGSALSGLIYFIYVTGFSGPDTYRSESTYYITFNTDDYEALAVYYNDYTWNLILATDKIAGRAAELTGISMEEINNCVWKPMMYDLRMITVYADHTDPEVAENIQKAIGQALTEFPVNEEGFKTIELWDGPHTSMVEKKLFTVRLLVIGGIAGFIISVLYICLKAALDMRVYTLLELKDKTGMSFAGYLFDGNGEYCDAMLAVNVEQAIGDNANIGICYADAFSEKTERDFDVQRLTDYLKKSSSVSEKVTFSFFQNNGSDFSSEISRYDSIILLIDQKKDTAQQVIKAFDTAKNWNKTVSTAIICNSSENFYRAYYFGKRRA